MNDEPLAMSFGLLLYQHREKFLQFSITRLRSVFTDFKCFRVLYLRSFVFAIPFFKCCPNCRCDLNVSCLGKPFFTVSFIGRNLVCIMSYPGQPLIHLSLIHISEPTRLLSISYAV